MLYPLLTLSDQTEMLYSEIKPGWAGEGLCGKARCEGLLSQCGLLAALVYLGGYLRFYPRRDPAL